MFGGIVTTARHARTRRCVCIILEVNIHRNIRGADKSLARLRRKQATATEDFDVHISYL